VREQRPNRDPRMPRSLLRRMAGSNEVGGQILEMRSEFRVHLAFQAFALR
jgi:hypothetical protein